MKHILIPLTIDIFSVIFSIFVFEIILGIQNKITSLKLVFVVRISLILVYLGLIFLTIHIVNIFFPELSSLEIGNIILLYNILIITYLFKYFFPRQKIL